MSHPCKLEERVTQPTLSIRTRAAVQDLSRVMGEAYGAIAQYLGSLQQPPAGPPFAAYYNMDMQDLDIELGFPVATALPGKDKIEAGTIPAGTYATCLYTGPYDAIESAYNALQAFIEEKGREATGVSYEMYLNDPQETPPEELQTQILFPLKGK